MFVMPHSKHALVKEMSHFKNVDDRSMIDRENVSGCFELYTLVTLCYPCIQY